MIKKIDILGIQIDNYTVREAMTQVDVFLNNTGMDTIEAISMEMLVQAREDEALKEVIQGLDLAIAGEKEILKAAGVMRAQRIRETVEKEFFKEFMKRILREQRSVYLFGETVQELEHLKDFLQKNYEGLNILGSFAMENCVGDFDGAVNEINIVSPDIIFSILPTPGQEYFLKENKEKVSAKIWFSLGADYANPRGVSRLKKFAKKLVHKGRLNSMISKYSDEEE